MRRNPDKKPKEVELAYYAPEVLTSAEYDERSEIFRLVPDRYFLGLSENLHGNYIEVLVVVIAITSVINILIIVMHMTIISKTSGPRPSAGSQRQVLDSKVAIS